MIERILRLAGKWSGRARTWMEPGAGPVEADWSGTFEPVLGGTFARFVYQSSVNEKPIAGELLIAFERGEASWRTAWIDTFHTGSAILVSQGPGVAEKAPIAVKGDYFVGAEHPRWGWRTEIDDAGVAGAGTLTIRMYNIEPDGAETLGVEITLSRA